MPRQYNIRWRRSDTSKLSHTIRKFNKKVFALEVGRPDLQGHIPQMLDYQEEKAKIKTRADLNKFIKKHERFLREGAEEIVKSEYGAVASKWEVKEFNLAQRGENIRRAKKRKKLEEKDVTIAGKTTGNKRAEMGKIKENEVKPSRKKFNKMTQKDWEKAFALFEKKLHSSYFEGKQRDMISNYIKGLIREGYSDDLLNMMNTIPLDKFEEIIDTDETATFDFIYDPIELKAKEDILLSLWEQHSAGENINDINIDNIIKDVENENIV